MKLAASVIVRNEVGRYLDPCVSHLLEFCDEIRILDNGSTDGLADMLHDRWPNEKRILCERQADAQTQAASLFAGHAHARQRLLDFTLEGDPTHILAIDADEFITDGPTLRRACSQNADAWAVCMVEVWNITRDRIETRQDGGWVEHDVAMLWRPDRLRGPMRIEDRGPATGRTPDTVTRGRISHSCSAVLHLGWANPAERQARYDRYAVADAGRYHNAHHLQSILWPDNRIQLHARAWPAALEPYRAEIEKRAGLVAA